MTEDQFENLVDSLGSYRVIELLMETLARTQEQHAELCTELSIALSTQARLRKLLQSASTSCTDCGKFSKTLLAIHNELIKVGA